MTDIFLVVSGGICVILGMIGCILPILPGPVLAYTGMLLFELTSAHPFTVATMIVFGVFTVAIAVLDYILPVYGTSILKGSKYGMWGSAGGLIIGAFMFFPVGIFLGSVLGALIGEMVSGRPLKDAFVPAIGSFLGFMTGTILKLTLTGVMGYYYFREVYLRFI